MGHGAARRGACALIEKVLIGSYQDITGQSQSGSISEISEHNCLHQVKSPLLKATDIPHLPGNLQRP